MTSKKPKNQEAGTADRYRCTLSGLELGQELREVC